MRDETWVKHPTDYRHHQVQMLFNRLGAGECVSLIGLSGMGKSNLLGFMTYRAAPTNPDAPACVLIDCNRLSSLTAKAFFRLTSHALLAPVDENRIRGIPEIDEDLHAVHQLVAEVLKANPNPLALLIDNFDLLAAAVSHPFFNNLRALRDAHKFNLTFLIATRRPLSQLANPEDLRELNDLFVANQVWIGPLAEPDARWALDRFASRHALRFETDELEALLHLSGRHPGLIKALASAWPEGEIEAPTSWLNHPAVNRECNLIWDDLPGSVRNAIRSDPSTDEIAQKAGIAIEKAIFSPVFKAFIAIQEHEGIRMDPLSGEVYREGVSLEVNLTAKEHALLAYLLKHDDAVCKKDILIRAVWPEDRVFERGVRDDSLAQLVRRLRVKIEPDPSEPKYLITVPGRGYRMVQPPTSHP